MNTKNKTSGYSLVEALVAISILLLALVGPMTIAAKGIQSSSFVREQTVAIFLAQEGLEAFTAARNDITLAAASGGDFSGVWTDFRTMINDSQCRISSGSGCNVDFSTTNPLLSGGTSVPCAADGSGCELYFDETNARAKYSLDSNDPQSPYVRVIEIIDVAGGGLQIESTVLWNSRLFGSQQQNVTLTTALFNLYE